MHFTETHFYRETVTVGLETLIFPVSPSTLVDTTETKFSLCSCEPSRFGNSGMRMLGIRLCVSLELWLDSSMQKVVIIEKARRPLFRGSVVALIKNSD